MARAWGWLRDHQKVVAVSLGVAVFAALVAVAQLTLDLFSRPGDGGGTSQVVPTTGGREPVGGACADVDLPPVGSRSGPVVRVGSPVDPRGVVEVGRIVEDGKGVADVAYRGDGRMVVGAFTDGTVTYWDAEDRREIVTFTTGRVIDAIAVSPDGKTLVLAGEAPAPIRLWDVASCSERATLALDADVADVAFSPDGSVLVAADHDGRVQVWDAAAEFRPGARAQLFTSHATGVAVSPDGRAVAVSGGDTDEAAGTHGGAVVVVDVATGEVRQRFDVADYHVASVDFGPDGKSLVSGDYGNAVRVWDLATGAAVAVLDEHLEAVRAVAFSPDGRTVASGSGDDERPSGDESDTSVRLWDATNRAAVGGSLATGEVRPVTAVAFSPDGTTLVAGNEGGELRVWRVRR